MAEVPFDHFDFIATAMTVVKCNKYCLGMDYKTILEELYSYARKLTKPGLVGTRGCIITAYDFCGTGKLAYTATIRSSMVFDKNEFKELQNAYAEHCANKGRVE